MPDHLFLQIISVPNLLKAFYEFRKGKRHRSEVAEFELNLEENIFGLYEELKNGTYQHGSYFQFKVFDPKLRIIHKASVRDRVIHQAVYRVLYLIFDQTFIRDSYSSRVGKGTHKAVKQLETISQKISHNYKQPCFALKLDIKSFFHSIDHQVLISILKKKIFCPQTIQLTEKIIKSFKTGNTKGLPLGNVTSQLFANIYLNEFDQYVTRHLGERDYIRFCDDIMIVKPTDDFFSFLSKSTDFLKTKLRLTLKLPKLKVIKLSWGFDFLGVVILPHHKVLRSKTKKRMWKNLKDNWQKNTQKIITRGKFNQIAQSYLGHVGHINGYKLSCKIEDNYGIRTINRRRSDFKPV